MSFLTSSFVTSRWFTLCPILMMPIRLHLSPKAPPPYFEFRLFLTRTPFPNPSPAPLMVQLDFSSEGAKSFLVKQKPTLEGVESQGEYLLVEANPDGNCFFGAAVLGGLLWAVSQIDSAPIQGVLDRFKIAIEGSGRTAYEALSEEQKVSVSCAAAATP